MADSPPLKVFLCHASEDKPIVRELFERLRADGFAPWLDSEALLPGQDWDLEIQKAMRASDAVIVCFSSASVSKEGYVQKEIKYAQDIQKEKPEGTIFFIPLQLEACEMPFSLRGIQWGHYYEADGYEKLVRALNHRAGQVKGRRGNPRPAFGTPLPKGEGTGVRDTLRGGDNSVVIGRDTNQSVIVPGSANVLNVHYGSAPGGGWRRPAAPRPGKPMIGRADEYQTIAGWLKNGKSAAITAAVQGTPGVGKTTLAEHLAAGLDGDFPGGVLYEALGSTFRDPMLANPILERWAALGGWIRQENRSPAPEEVRALLSGHGALLVVLDDVWDLDAIQPLQNALPKEACLLVTTRSRRIARELSGEIYPLDVLSRDDALNLLKTKTRAAEQDLPLLEQLAKALGNHAQALEIAAASLARRPRGGWQAVVDEIARRVRKGSGFGDLPLPGDEEREDRVEAALAVSYHDLTPELRRRFRLLGALAPDSEFSAEAAVRLWGLDAVREAEESLAVFEERGLGVTLTALTPVSPLPAGEGLGVRARQHTLLRAYALALLKKEGEEEAARRLHAQTYNALMREADDRQVYYLLLPEYPQLRHAFEWAIEHDLDLAQELAGNTANLQAAFYLVRENYAWAKQLVEKSSEQDEETKGRAIGNLANALARLANLPEEDRRQRLREALAAYDEALRFRRPDTAPLDYAMTQNNRGTVLSDLAASPGEDRRARLREALAAYDEALRFYRPDTAPLAYAGTQNNRGAVLRDLAASPEEDRRQRLREALAAYDEALKFRRPDTAPLDYAMTQNNRGAVLSGLAASPEEDRRQRLREALAAYDEALNHYRPDTAPLDYAMTQNNRGAVLSDLAASPEEDRRQRLREALAAYDEALNHYRPDTAPLDYAMTQGNLGYLHIDLGRLPGENWGSRFRQALECVLTALSLFAQIGHAPFAQQAANQLRWLREQDKKLFDAIWKEMKLPPLPF